MNSNENNNNRDDSYLQKKTKPKESINEVLVKAQIEQNDTDLDEKIVQDLIISIKDKFTLNLNQRKKYPNEPKQFQDSEEQLNEDISILQKIAAYPSLIPFFIENKGLELICSLITHPNSDIVNPIINLIEELTEGDFLQELEDPKAFLELLLSNSLFTLLVNHFKQLLQESDEDNEQYKSDILSILENYIEIYPPSANILGQKTDILSCLLSSVKYSESIDVKVFSSEILQSLLLNSEANQSKFASLKGLPHLVNLLVELRERQVKGGSYDEFINNIVNSICTSLFNKTNKEIFNQTDGLNIMIDFMKENNAFRHLAIKVLNYALQNHKDNCNGFISANGLSVLFPYFIGKGLKKYHVDQSKSERVVLGEEHCYEIIVNLFKYVEGVERDRLLYKFKEEKFKKCNRVIELYLVFRDKNKNKDIDMNIEKDEDDKSEENEKLNKEEYILQLITLMVLELMKQDKLMEVKNKVISLLNEKKIEIDEMTERISKTIENMGNDDDDEDELSPEFSYKVYLTNLINKA